MPVISDSSSLPSVPETSSVSNSNIKPPRRVLEHIYAFPPNRDTLGGTAYVMLQPEGNVLIDPPAFEPGNQTFLQEQGGVRWLMVTHRGAIGKTREFQQAFGCEVLIQEQEAYLLPEVTVTSFEDSHSLLPDGLAIWTPGHSPGSSCFYTPRHGGVLFTGRHLLPDRQGHPVPLRISKTFHWPRQIRSIKRLIEQFSPTSLTYICPGANTGFLRGQRYIDRAYEKLQQLNLDELLKMQPGL